MRKFLAILLVAFSLAACKPLNEQINVHDYSLEKVDNVALGLSQLSADANLLIEVDNNSGLDITLSDLAAEVYTRSGKKVATVGLATRIGKARPVIHRKTSEEVEVPLKIDFDSPLSAITLLAMSMQEYGEKGYTVDYDLTLKAGCIKKRFREDNVPVKELLNRLQR